ncbi:MAG: hypothetical protein NTZ59_11510 [Bacteroidetes bacterium]|nr:hypothetical protein [Bacteroidota bacterium]
MNKDVAIMIAYFLGIASYMFYDFLKCGWEAKRKRKAKYLKDYNKSQLN